MTSLPFVAPDKPLGIVISSGKDRRPTVKFWAYLWANDDEDTSRHWHEVVPVGPTG